MITYTIFNDKGGVGKSTLTYHLAGAFAEAGNRVLVIDLDRQMSQSHRWRPESLATRRNLYDVLMEQCTLSDVVIPSKNYPNVFLAPASPHLGESLTSMLHEQPDGQIRLAQALRETNPDVYDVTIIDTRPDRAIATRNGLAAADFLVVPFEPDDFSIEGLSSVNDLVERIRKAVNPDLQIAGYLLNKIKTRRTLERDYIESIRSLEDFPVFQTALPDSSVIKSATNARKPLNLTRPATTEAELFRSLLREIIARTESDLIKEPTQSYAQESVH